MFRILGLLFALGTLCVPILAEESILAAGKSHPSTRSARKSTEHKQGVSVPPEFGAGLDAPIHKSAHPHRTRHSEAAAAVKEKETEAPVKRKLKKASEKNVAAPSIEKGHGPKSEAPEEEVHFEGTEGELNEHALGEYVVIPIAVAIIAALFLGACVERHEISWLPESVVTIVVGICLGFYMKGTIGHTHFFQHEEVFNETCATLLNLFLLPILIFESGWSLRYKDFASQAQYIMLFAVVGSLISFLVVGVLILWTGQAGLHSITAPRTAFAFASLIAATDPVATLATYSKLKVDPLLNIIVFGDSTFNDAVAIVLFKVLNSNAIMGTPESRPSLSSLSLNIVWGILKIFLGSLTVGLLVGAIFLLIVRFSHMRDSPRLEILALVCMAYISFAVGETVGMSGIIATMFCSILLGLYARPHLSGGGSLLASYYLKQLACLMDAAVFLLVGVCVVNLGPRGTWFGIWAMLFCLAGRAAAVFPIGHLTNAIKRNVGRQMGIPQEQLNLLSANSMFMVWHAGLRGAIALVLCMQLGPWVDDIDGAGTRHILQTATYLVIVAFLMIFGGSTEHFLKKLGVPMGSQVSQDKLYRAETTAKFQSNLHTLDEKIMVPLFIGQKRLADSINEGDNELEVEDVLKKAGF